MSKSIIFSLIAVIISSLFLQACNSQKAISIEEILQQPVSAKIYTCYNIFYSDKNNISAINYQKGDILPVGSEVKIIEATDKKIVFKAASQDGFFTITYPKGKMMLPIEEYIQRTFSAKDEEEISRNIKSSVFEKIKRGVVEEGMTRNEVIIAYGYPIAYRTPSLKEDTWIYWTGEMETKRVVFKGDKVVSVFVIE